MAKKAARKSTAKSSVKKSVKEKTTPRRSTSKRELIDTGKNKMFAKWTGEGPVQGDG